MEKIKLSNRLRAIANFVPYASNVADIGTDHGYIPVWLAQNKMADHIVAADINHGPLQHARETAMQHGVSEFIRFELCSGLEFDGSSEYDTFIIAGMGGELIASILEAAPWTKSQNTTLILQPNSRIPHLVEWLIDSGFAIADAKLVKDAGKLYQVFLVKHRTSQRIESESDRLINRLYFEKHDPLLGEYLNILLNRYRNAEKGMLAGKTEDPELENTRTMIADLQNMLEEVAKWQL